MGVEKKVSTEGEDPLGGLVFKTMGGNFLSFAPKSSFSLDLRTRYVFSFGLYENLFSKSLIKLSWEMNFPTLKSSFMFNFMYLGIPK